MKEKTEVSQHTLWNKSSIYQLTPEITQDKILETLNQEDVFEFYGVKVVFNEHFVSPLRRDTYPTCSFKWIGNMLFFRDWSEDSPITCFQLVMRIYGCNYKNALEHIYKDMILNNEHNYKRFIESKTIDYSYDRVKTKSKKSIIKVKTCAWKKEAKEYFKQYGLTSKQIKKFKIFPIDKVWINDKLIWTYSPHDPAVGYYFGDDEKGNQRWKIYFFNRKHYRFVGNTNRINGWVQLPEKGEILIITKSLKDVACLDIFDIPAIAMQNETTIPYDYIIDELKEKFTNLISFYDFDYTGIVNANKLKKLYDIPYMFLTNGRFGTEDYSAKDFSDYLKLRGKKDAKSLLYKNIRLLDKDYSVL